MQLLQRRNLLYAKAAERRAALEESFKNQMFERDCDETKIWIHEKLKAASDEGYLVSRLCHHCQLWFCAMVICYSHYLCHIVVFFFKGNEL